MPDKTRCFCLLPKAVVLVLLACILVSALFSCEKSARMHYTAAQNAQGAGDWGTALTEYEAILAKLPDDAMATLGKGRALYELGRFEEALPFFEKFLEQTKSDPAIFKDERYDAEFYRDKCKQGLGQEVPQDPTHIPEPPMGE